MRGLRGVAFGLILLLGFYALTGFLLLGRGEMAVVVGYDLRRIRGLNDIILLIYGDLPERDVKMISFEDKPLLSTPLGRLYWHPPKPLYIHYKFRVGAERYELRTTVILPLATDEEGRLLYWCLLTRDGFKTFSLYNYIRDLLSGENPYEGLEIPVIIVDGRYRIVDVEKFIETYRVEENETQRYPWLYPRHRGHNLIRELLENAFQVYVMNKTYQTYRQIAELHPELTIEDRVDETYRIISRDLPELVEGLLDDRGMEMLEKRYGIEVSRELQVRIEYITP